MIVTPENMDFSNKNIIMIISGLPGTGKTTLALSAPDVLLIDADEGMARVKPEHRKDSSLSKTYEEVLEDIKAATGVYKTIVVDTGGSFVDMLKDWAIRNDRTIYTSKGNIDTRAVFRVVKTEFLRISYELKLKFNMIYLFHVSKEKNADGYDWFEILCEGSAKTMVYQPADLAGYLHIVNGERYIGFTPTMNYNAKSAYGIKGLIKIKELTDSDSNDFLTKLFQQVKKNIASEKELYKPQKEAYEKAITQGKEIINTITDVNTATKAGDDIQKIEHALTSKAEIVSLFKTKLADVGISWDAKNKKYVEKSQ